MKQSKKKQSNEHNSLDELYHRRQKALERVISTWEKGETAGDDELNRALDALTVAHVAATFEWASGH